DYFYDIFGFNITEDIPMETPFNVVHPDDYQLALDKVNQAVNKGIDYVSEFRIHHGKTSEIRYIRTQAEVLWRDNRPYKLVGVVKDYTEEKQLELKFENQNEELRQFYDNINAGFWMRE